MRVSSTFPEQMLSVVVQQIAEVVGRLPGVSDPPSQLTRSVLIR
jgi:hypothetical protein